MNMTLRQRRAPGPIPTALATAAEHRRAHAIPAMALW
jgi:hypothetical protein